MELLEGAELEVLDQEAGGEKAGSSQRFVNTPEKEAAEPVAAHEFLSLLL